MTWFLLKDDIPLGGWQSGLLTADGHKKPAFRAFQYLTAGARRVPVARLK